MPGQRTHVWAVWINLPPLTPERWVWLGSSIHVLITDWQDGTLTMDSNSPVTFALYSAAHIDSDIQNTVLPKCPHLQ